MESYIETELTNIISGKHLIKSDTMITDHKLFDLSYLEEIDDKYFLAEVITLYIKDTYCDLEEMKRALDAGAVETVYETAHKLKSSTGMLQANKLFAILEQTEKIAKDGEENGQLAELVRTAQFEFDQLKTALEVHMRGIKTAA
ncbi:MAG: Hpt domain-containing protein [Ferruginibacter sp.]